MSSRIGAAAPRSLPASWTAFREISESFKDDQPGLETFVTDLMTKEPSGRWWTMNEIRELLEN